SDAGVSRIHRIDLRFRNKGRDRTRAHAGTECQYPTLDTGIQFLHVLEYDRALCFGIEGQYGVSAKLLHRCAQFAAGCSGKQIAMESLAGQRARDGAIRADLPKVEAKLLSDRQGEGMPASGDQYDFDSLRMGAAQCGHVSIRNLELGIQ